MTIRSRGEGETKVVHGSGDVFSDLGIELTAEEAIKVEIARHISRVIVDTGMTQTQAANKMGLDQAKVSSVTRGRLDGFSIQRLINMLIALGWDVNIQFERSTEERGRVTVGGQSRAYA
jgi:predicted XRE-type DNA-binding protein